MRTVSSSILLVIGLGLFAAGCNGEIDSDETGSTLDGRGFEPQTGGPMGTGGINGFKPSEFHLKKYALLQGFHHPAADPVETIMPNPVVYNLLDVGGSTAGLNTFHYAISCGFPHGEWLKDGNNTFIGNEFVHDAGKWRTAPIYGEAEVKNGLLSCMAARLNPYGVEIPIMLLGPMVPADGVTDSDDYPFREMVISAVHTPGADAKVIINVWPLEQLKKSCGNQIEGSLGTRICDNNPALCGLVLRSDFDSACTGTPGNYFCDGVPAIETRLRQVDAPYIHPVCNISRR